MKEKNQGWKVRINTVRLVVDGESLSLEPTLNKNAMYALQEVADNIAEGEELILDMISELEDKIYTTSKDRAIRLKHQLKELEVRKLEATDKSTRGLMRRYKRAADTDTSDGLDARVQELSRELMGEKEEKNPTICFLSRESSFQETKEAAEEVDEILKLDKGNIPWERLFGLVGIPVCHTVQNYLDPMNIGVNEHLSDVVPSKEAALNQKSLWSLSGTNENSRVNLDNLVSFTGFKSKVTAVVPIKSWNHPAVWKAYQKGTTISSLGKIVMSAQLRGAHAPLQQDQSAFTTATLLRTISLWTNPSDAQASIMADLLDTIQFTDERTKGISAPVQEFISQPNIHIITHMNSPLAPFAKMLESKDALSFAGSEESQDLWRAITSNSIYWHVRRTVQHMNRNEILNMLLENVEEKELDTEIMQKFSLDFTLSARIFNIGKKFKEKEQIKPDIFRDNHGNASDFQNFITGTNFYVYLAVEVVKALLCIKSPSRFKHPRMFDNEEAAWSWMTSKFEDQKKQIFAKEDANESMDNFFKNLQQLPLNQFSRQLNTNIPQEFETFTSLGQQGKKRTTKFKIEQVVDLLKAPEAVNQKEKLSLILFCKCKDTQMKWGNGKCLRNGNIAEKV